MLSAAALRSHCTKIFSKCAAYDTVAGAAVGARDKAAALPDQERRAYAAAMAARFADMLGLHEDDTESDDQS
jgi:hypothetical protein